jgi:hypothetical protein
MMTELERAVVRYLRHNQVTYTKSCRCPADSWAPCGGQYEGRYSPACPQHSKRQPLETSHHPAGCPVRSVDPLVTAVEGI